MRRCARPTFPRRWRMVRGEFRATRRHYLPGGLAVGPRRTICGSVTSNEWPGSLRRDDGFSRHYAARVGALTQKLSHAWMLPSLSRVARALLTTALASASGQAAKCILPGAQRANQVAPCSDERPGGFNAAPDSVVFTTMAGSLCTLGGFGSHVCFASDACPLSRQGGS